jgi:hypothetical protein
VVLRCGDFATALLFMVFFRDIVEGRRGKEG